MRCEGIGDDMEALVRNAAGAELIGLRSRDGDDGIESAEDESLEGFIRAVLQSATGKTVYGGYYWNFQFVPSVSAYDIRPVTMCVDDVYGSRAAKAPNERQLAQVAAPGDDERHQLHVRVLERGGKVPPVSRPGERRGDDDGMACTPLRCREGGHDGLEPPDRSGSEQVQYGK